MEAASLVGLGLAEDRGAGTMSLLLVQGLGMGLCTGLGLQQSPCSLLVPQGTYLIQGL